MSREITGENTGEIKHQKQTKKAPFFSLHCGGFFMPFC